MRGNKGGFWLVQRAATIGVGDVIRRTEDRFAVVECLNPATKTCSLIGQCKLGNAHRKAMDAFLAVLDNVTLADNTTNGPDILHILSLSPPGGLDLTTACVRHA